MSMDMTLARDVAIANYCLRLAEGSDLTDVTNALLPYMTDTETAFLVLSNISQILRDDPGYKSFDAVLERFRELASALVPSAAPGVVAAMEFVETAQDPNAEQGTLYSLYASVGNSTFEGGWRKVWLESARTMLSMLIGRRLLTTQSELAESLLAGIAEIGAEDMNQFARLNAGFLWRSYEADS